MESILKSEVFFFIASISVVVFTIVLIIFSFYLIKTMKNFSDISDNIKNTVNDATSSLGEVGNRITESSLFSFIFGKGKRKNKK